MPRGKRDLVEVTSAARLVLDQIKKATGIRDEAELISRALVLADKTAAACRLGRVSTHNRGVTVVLHLSELPFGGDLDA